MFIDQTKESLKCDKNLYFRRKNETLYKLKFKRILYICYFLISLKFIFQQKLRAEKNIDMYLNCYYVFFYN